MSTWIPVKAWKRGRGSVSRQIQIVKRKRRRVVTKADAAHFAAGTGKVRNERGRNLWEK